MCLEQREGVVLSTEESANAAQNDDSSEFPPVPYKKPSWAAPLKRRVWFEVLKSGTIIEKVEFEDNQDCMLVCMDFSCCCIMYENCYPVARFLVT